MKGEFRFAVGGEITGSYVDAEGVTVITGVRAIEFSVIPGDSRIAPYVLTPARGSDPAIREALAAYAHEAWAGWMAYLFEQSRFNDDGTITIPQWAVERWDRQASTPYADLPEDERASDRIEADRMLAIVTGATDGE